MSGAFLQMILGPMSNLSVQIENWLKSGGPYFPTTASVGFLEAELPTVVTAFMKWREKIQQLPVCRTIQGEFDAGIEALLPLTAGDIRRWIFFDVGGWTAFFNNYASGTDAGPTSAVMARNLGCRALRVVVVPKGVGTYPATMLEIYGPTGVEPRHHVRTISAANDGGRWRFDLFGVPQPFEDEDAYTVRRIQDRFTPQMLARYLAALGVSAFDVSAYSSPQLVELTNREPETVEHFTFEEARLKFG